MNAMISSSRYFRISFTTGSPGTSPLAQNVCKTFNFSLPGKYVCPDWYNFSCSQMTPKYAYAENVLSFTRTECNTALTYRHMRHRFQITETTRCDDNVGFPRDIFEKNACGTKSLFSEHHGHVLNCKRIVQNVA